MDQFLSCFWSQQTQKLVFWVNGEIAVVFQRQRRKYFWKLLSFCVFPTGQLMDQSQSQKKGWFSKWNFGKYSNFEKPPRRRVWLFLLIDYIIIRNRVLINSRKNTFSENNCAFSILVYKHRAALRFSLYLTRSKWTNWHFFRLIWLLNHLKVPKVHVLLLIGVEHFNKMDKFARNEGKYLESSVQF